MTAGHRHADLMRQYAEEAALSETPWVNWELRNIKDAWQPCVNHPAWNPEKAYRRKPRTVPIGNRDVPAPLSSPPAKGTTYWVPILSYEAPACCTWDDDREDHRLLKRRLAFATESDALAFVDAVLELL